MKKTKILMISDHAMTHSGVGVQSKHLIEGLVNTGNFKITQLGATKNYQNFNINLINKDFKIIPCKGFGTKNEIRNLIKSESPEALIIFSDSRFFNNIFEMSEEIRKNCPIVWWHVWDNRPTPHFNKSLYDAVDQINCISTLTYSMCKKVAQNKTSYIPHCLPSGMFYELKKENINKIKENTLGKDKKDDFIVLWANRNCKRKRAADVLKSWQIFLFDLEEKYGHKNATLIMHTDPYDAFGPNLMKITESLEITDNVRFSSEIIGFEEMNALHNISDVCINIAYSEGFGLTTLEAMKVGKPIIVAETGGLVPQVINQKTLKVNGISIKPKVKVLSGNQEIPYIYEDYVDVSDVSKAIFEVYEWGKEKRKEVGNEAKRYVDEEFCYKVMINNWENSIYKTIEKWKTNK